MTTVAQPRTSSDQSLAATLPVVRALLDEARRKNYHRGVLGIRTRPVWSGGETFVYEGTPVRVVTCESSLAVREALLDADPEGWLVVLTDRSDEDLGAGLLSHFAFNRLRTPDPWEAVRHRFSATGIDPALTARPDHRHLAVGLLAAAPPTGFPPARGGVLTADHALRSVAETHLGLDDPVVDARAVLTWTADDATARRLAELRTLAGDALTGAVLDWAAGRAGALREPLLHLLRGGRHGDALPLGVLMGVLADAARSTDGDSVRLAREAFIRLEPRLGRIPATLTQRAWASEADLALSRLLEATPGRASGERLLARADALLAETHATSLAGRSALLPSGLASRFGALAAAIRAVDTESPSSLAAVEAAWGLVDVHRLAAEDRRRGAFLAAVRLLRWLRTSDTPAPDLSAAIARQVDADAWVDSAVNDASRGVGEPDLGSALAAVLNPVRARRAGHDLGFAAGLVRHTADDPDGEHHGVAHLEELLSRSILPLARRIPVLLLVLDGMSVAVAHEVASDVLAHAADGWAEALLPGAARRTGALAVLPTLTELSRASLLCGELRSGGQDVERHGYAALTAAHGLAGSALFHKKPLDSSRPGYALADDVGAAIDDLTGRPLVTCVLNAIDDALDRSDPGGTDWRADAVRHLEPLLARARRAGRVVVLTADHGHVVERRLGTMRPHAGITSGRSRPATEPAGDGEVLIEGRRVLTADHRAVLAVDEQLRYGPLKAGYHGGAAPAEAVVPVVVLVNGPIPAEIGLTAAVAQQPGWWDSPLPPTSVAADSGTLFELPAPAAPSGHPLAQALLRCPGYRAQRRQAGRVAVNDDQLAALLDALLDSPANRLPAIQAAVALGVATVDLRGAVPQVQRLLNVEGYGVLTVDVDGATLVLDVALLREQFGL